MANKWVIWWIFLIVYNFCVDEYNKKKNCFTINCKNGKSNIWPMRWSSCGNIWSVFFIQWDTKVNDKNKNKFLVEYKVSVKIGLCSFIFYFFTTLALKCTVETRCVHTQQSVNQTKHFLLKVYYNSQNYFFVLNTWGMRHTFIWKYLFITVLCFKVIHLDLFLGTW